MNCDDLVDGVDFPFFLTQFGLGSVGPSGLALSWGGFHQSEVYALNVETISGSTGDQIMLSVSYREHDSAGESYEQTSESLDLRVLLEQAFGPSP